MKNLPTPQISDKLPILFIFFGLFFVSRLHATNYYVSNSGDNNNSGLSLVDAFLTLQHAADLTMPGDSVFVSNGTYAGFDLRDKNGVNGAPIVFKSLGTQVLIDESGPIRSDGINIENADYIVIDGFIVNDMIGNGIRLVLSDYCVVRNCRCDNNAERGIFTGFTDNILIEYNICTNAIDEHGIYVSNSSDNPIIRFNECYGNNNIGIHMNGDLSAGGDGIISNAQVYGNIIHDNGGAAGINMDGVQDPIVYNNLIYNNHFSQGIALFQQDGAIVTNGAKIFNNTIIVPSDGRWGILVRDGANINTEIYNNIILNQHAWRGCIAIEDATSFSSDFNIVNDKMSDDGDGSTISFIQWQNLGFGLHSLLADSIHEIFTQTTSSDFHLVNTSQAIDAGDSSVSSIVGDDLDGIMRPQGLMVDIGCYEYEWPASQAHIYSDITGIIIYPNPFVNSVVIDGMLADFDVKVLDSNGQVYADYSNVTAPIVLDLDMIPSGLHFISVSNVNDQTMSIHKILKQ